MATQDALEWDPEDPTPGYLFMRLADHIEARIRRGDFPVNSMLPNEREMVLEYHVSIDTVRRALEELRDRGAVVTLPSRGTYIAKT